MIHHAGLTPLMQHVNNVAQLANRQPTFLAPHMPVPVTNSSQPQTQPPTKQTSNQNINLTPTTNQNTQNNNITTPYIHQHKTPH